MKKKIGLVAAIVLAIASLVAGWCAGTLTADKVMDVAKDIKAAVEDYNAPAVQTLENN